jgi:hypothetical protein
MPRERRSKDRGREENGIVGKDFGSSKFGDQRSDAPIFDADVPISSQVLISTATGS